jgi:hypothetical protein
LAQVMWVDLRCAITAITITLLMPARLTAITDLAGLQAACLSVLAHGTDGADAAGAVGAVATTVAEAGVDEVTLADTVTQVVVATWAVVATQADAVIQAAATAEARPIALVVSTEIAEAVASMVAAAPTAAVVDTEAADIGKRFRSASEETADSVRCQPF